MSEHTTPFDPAGEGEAGRPAERPRSGDEVRVDNAELRAELGATVEELARRVDVPSRVRARRDETLAQARATGRRAWSKIEPTTVGARRWVEQQPGRAAAAVVVLLIGLGLLARRRSATRRRS